MCRYLRTEIPQNTTSNNTNITVDVSKTSPAEVNRMYDAWIPTESTRVFLMQALAAGAKYQLPADKVLRPRLAMADTQVHDRLIAVLLCFNLVLHNLLICSFLLNYLFCLNFFLRRYNNSSKVFVCVVAVLYMFDVKAL